MGRGEVRLALHWENLPARVGEQIGRAWSGSPRSQEVMMEAETTVAIGVRMTGEMFKRVH